MCSRSWKGRRCATAGCGSLMCAAACDGGDRLQGAGGARHLAAGGRGRTCPRRHHLRRHHRVWEAGPCADSRGSAGPAAGEPDPQSRVRRGGPAGGGRRPRDDAASRQRAAAGNERRAPGAPGADRGDVEPGHPSGRAVAGQRRRLGGSGPAVASRPRDDWGGGGRGQGARGRPAAGYPGGEGRSRLHQRDAGPDRPRGAAGTRGLGAMAHGPRCGRHEPRGSAGDAGAVRPPHPRGASPPVPAAVGRLAQRPAGRERDPRVAPRTRSAGAGRLFAALHTPSPRRGRRGDRLRRAAGRRRAERGYGQPPRLRGRGAVRRQLPRSANRPRARRAGHRPHHAGGARRAAARARREPGPVVGPAGLPVEAAGPRVGVHVGPDRGGGAGGGLPATGDAGERAVGPHRGQPGGRGADGHDRGVEDRAHARQCRTDRRHRAARLGAGARVLEAARAGARCESHLYGGAARGPGAGGRPFHERRDRARGGGGAGGAVRSRGSGAVTAPRTVRAARGPSRTCKGWIQEAALRMLMNNLDPEVAERPQDLVVYGGTGKAARNWACFDAICRTLTTLGDDETLLVQSGKPVGVFATHPDAPRVLIANANLVGRWATWDVFRELERAGLIMFGQMTAGSWIYIGTQGILQGTYETLGAVARRHFGGSLRGRIVLTGGLGGMGGAQPLAATMHDAVCLVVEVDPARVQRRLETRYLDKATTSLDEALRWCDEARRAGRALSVGLVGNCAEVVPELARRGFTPDVLTDQTSAHDPLNGYIPPGLSVPQASELPGRDTAEYP